MFKRIIVSKTMRRRVSWLVAGVLILPFVLFFHTAGRTPIKGPGGRAGTIFGKHIPWESYEDQYRWVKTQWENRLHEIPQALEPIIRQTTWDRLLLLMEAKRRHLRVDDQALAGYIERIPAFQDNGQFRPEYYHRYLQAIKQSPQHFEGLLRNDLVIEQLVNSIKASVSITDADVKDAYIRAHEQLRAILIVFAPSDFASKIASSLSDDDLRPYYSAHLESVRIPEQLIIEYAGKTIEELIAEREPNEEESREFYEDRRSNFTKPDGTVKPFEDAKEEVKNQLREERARKQLRILALDLRDDLDSKNRFEEILATRHLTSHTVGPFSTNSPSASIEPELLLAVAKLPPGQPSDVVETNTATYLARVTERIASRVPSFEEVRDKVRAQLTEERSRAAAKDAASACQGRINAHLAAGLRFEEIAAAEDPALPAHSAQFTRTGSIDPIGYQPSVNDAAFSTKLGHLSNLIETPQGFVLVRPEALIPADESKFTEDQVVLRKDLLTQKQSTYLEQWLKDIRERAHLTSFVETPSAE